MSTHAITGRLSTASNMVLSVLRGSNQTALSRLSRTANLSISTIRSHIRGLRHHNIVQNCGTIVSSRHHNLTIGTCVTIAPVSCSRRTRVPSGLGGVSNVVSYSSITNSPDFVLAIHIRSPDGLRRLLGLVRHAISIDARAAVILRHCFTG